MQLFHVNRKILFEDMCVYIPAILLSERACLVSWLERRRGRVVRAARLWCRKSPYRVSSRLGCAMRRLENSLCQPSRKWVPFSNKGRIRQRKERDGLRLSSAVPKIQWDSNPHCPYGYKAMGHLYLFYAWLPFVKSLLVRMRYACMKSLLVHISYTY